MKKITIVFYSLLVCSNGNVKAQDISQAIENLSQENQLSASVYLDLEHDDNIRKTKNNKESDLKEQVGVNVAYGYNSTALDLKLDYGLSHEVYQDESFDGKTRLQGYSSAKISTNPARYAWLVSHDQSIANVNNRNANTPDNLDQRSILTTGPDLYLQLSPVDILSGSLRYVDVQYDEQDKSDSQRNQAQLSWNHRLNSLDKVGVNARYTDADGDGRDSSYSQEHIGVTYSGQMKYGSYYLEFGDSSLKRDQDGFKDVDGNYYKANFNTSWDANRLGFSYNQDITDSSIGLSQNYNARSVDQQDFNNGDTNFDDIDIVTRTRYQAIYRRQNVDGRLGFSLALSQDEEDFETLLTDQKTQSIVVGFQYAIAQNLSSSINYRFENIEYLDEPLLGEDEISLITANINHRIGDEWSFKYGLSYGERNNDEDILREYEYLRTTFRVNYRFR
jgi:hypothetical protein